ncbi:patatin-like phospholipase family protein [Ectothiorhodospiraceae bacterium WFHF3C12]|nr:patatin-like phospholipase family protein [Ectothiorhodospiraceae bacterium WFHF3C12]
MDYETLLQDPQIQALRDELHALRGSGRVFSDVVDGEGNQYVDLVMEGGGTLGLALVGYIWALEEAGIRFLGIGGTSAGSIGAMLLAGLDVPQARKSPALMEALSSVDFIEFVDGGYSARKLADAISDGRRLPALFWGSLQAVRVIFGKWRRWGLNPGDSFEQWLEGTLRQSGIDDLGALEQRHATRPDGLGLRGEADNAAGGPRTWKLAVIAADVATQSKVVFPAMGPLYFDVDRIHPARFVRASMAIPIFFRALRPDIPREAGYRERWKALMGLDIGERDELPEYAVFVDGGVLSNFPIAEFHVRQGIPQRPTFGVKLGSSHQFERIEGVFELLTGIFNSARRILDKDFLRRNPDYDMLVAEVDTKGYNWLRFSMDEEEQLGLIKLGASAARDFLKSFDWAAYKRVRQSMAEADRIHAASRPADTQGDETGH